MDQFVQHLSNTAAPHRVIVDCSSSEGLAKNYM